MEIKSGGGAGGGATVGGGAGGGGGGGELSGRGLIECERLSVDNLPHYTRTILYTLLILYKRLWDFV